MNAEQEANKKIAEILAEVDSLLATAEDIATKAGVGFYWPGPEHGMGGYYNSKSGWNSSSYSC